MRDHSEFFFRSETEVCWAYMLVNSGLSISYEPERYKTRHGWYYPDFYCRELDMIFEVKGGEPTNEEIEKLIDVENQAGKFCAFLCCKPNIDSQGVCRGYIMTTDGFRIDLRNIAKCFDITGLNKIVSDSLCQWHSFVMTLFSKVGGFNLVQTKTQGEIEVMSETSNWARKLFIPMRDKLKTRRASQNKTN